MKPEPSTEVEASATAEMSTTEHTSSERVPESREDRIFTVPNLISLTRLSGSFPVCWLLLVADNLRGAALLWAVLFSTDRLDGWWARRFNAVSKLGKQLDATADRGALIVCVAAVGVYGAAPWWLVALTLAREILVALVGLFLMGMFGSLRIDATFCAKCSNVGITATFLLFVISEASSAALADALRVAGWACAVPALFLSYFSAVQYARLARGVLRDNRSGR